MYQPIVGNVANEVAEGNLEAHLRAEAQFKIGLPCPSRIRPIVN